MYLLEFSAIYLSFKKNKKIILLATKSKSFIRYLDWTKHLTARIDDNHATPVLLNLINSITA